jgi:hypothetical protein
MSSAVARSTAARATRARTPPAASSTASARVCVTSLGWIPSKAVSSWFRTRERRRPTRRGARSHGRPRACERRRAWPRRASRRRGRPGRGGDRHRVRRVRAVRPRRNAECRDDPAAARLREAGILYAPDFVINAGGVLNSLGAEHLGWTREQIEERLAGIVATLGGDLRESGRRRNQHRGSRRGAGREPPEVGAVVDIARRSH